MTNAHNFAPDWVSPPGDTVVDMLEARGWTQVELAQRLGFTTKHVSQMITGKVTISEDAALRLERVIGGDVRFWLNREAQYREQLMRQTEISNLTDWVDWLDKLPVRELMKSRAICLRRIDKASKPAIVADLLQFFGVSSPETWHERYVKMEVAFRRTRAAQSDNIGAISAWLRLGEVQAEKLTLPKYDRATFVGALEKIRRLTIKPPQKFEPAIRQLCAKSGVALLLVPAIPRAHVSGVARWLGGNKPLIQLSLYGKTNDKFWFTFFHEAAHLLHHNRNEVFLDDIGGRSIGSKEEDEANAWAADFLIPEKVSAEFRTVRSRAAVLALAERLGIHPGIVVGRLQHEGIIDVGHLNGLKSSIRFSEDAEAS